VIFGDLREGGRDRWTAWSRKQKTASKRVPHLDPKVSLDRVYLFGDREVVEIEVDNVSVTDIDSAITEGGGGLSSVLPSIVDLIVPALIGEVPKIPVATIAGFDLADAELAMLTTPTSDFVVLRADLTTLADATTPTEHRSSRRSSR
jgi:hypothetical protein